ncbi:MAG: Cytochrome c2 precursor [Candidatus Hodgkinia cicadicola]|nr:MAG: Cytochrome c2 precursor [Candidatus Hodgkinia cicadicola]
MLRALARVKFNKKLCLALKRAFTSARTWFVCSLLAALAITPLALISNKLFPCLAFGEAIAATTASAAPSTSLKRLLLSSSVHRGAKFYNKCASCHSIGRHEPRRAGPSLWNIVFGNVAAEHSFNYSLALRARAHTQWGFEALNKFLKSPSSYAKGTYMPFSGLTDPAERMDVLSYLNSKSVKPRNIAKFKFKR